MFKDGLLANPPTHYLDTRHLSENIRKSSKRDDKLLQIVTKRTKAKKFTLDVDVVDRCTVEINQAHALHAGDAAKVKTSSLTPNKHWYLAVWGIMICAENIL